VLCGITKVKKTYCYARTIEILTPSVYRTEPVCPIYRPCGGCQLQALSYEKQLDFKTEKVAGCFKRIGGFEVEVEAISDELASAGMKCAAISGDEKGEGTEVTAISGDEKVEGAEVTVISGDEKVEGVKETYLSAGEICTESEKSACQVQNKDEKSKVLINRTIGMEHPWNYRNKAQFPIGLDKSGNPAAGFYARRTHNVIPTKSCAIEFEGHEAILEAVLNYIKQSGETVYDEISGKGLVRHVLMRKGFSTGEIMVVLVINGKRLRNEALFVELLKAIPGIASIQLNVNREKTNVILGTECRTLWGKAYITDKIGDVSFNISALSFYQVNPVQTKVLYEKALEFAGLTGKETVWDLYCGIGTISLFLAKNAKNVYGVEIIPQAVENAKENARLNGFKNAEFFVGAAEEVYIEKKLPADVVVVDPPRKGLDSELVETICKMQPKRIVYVSCDPATLARDAAGFAAHDYKIEKIQPVDMFPGSVHVETVALLSQQKPDDRIEVEIELDELDLTSAESKATYAEIKDYVLKEYGLKVSNLYISQVKRKCGIEVGENYNLPKSEDSRQPQCPVEKEKAIRDALEYFRMI
jgi:23S rRNA (uracil1939-C5)-methyltransferase